MTDWMKGKDPDRREGNGRRWEDNQTCPFHEIKCNNIRDNKEDIDHIKENMVKKEDLVEIKEALNKKAPRWVVVTMITTAVTIMIALVAWIGSSLDVIATVEANQKIIMQAFDIKPIPK